MAEAFTSCFSTCQKSGLKPGPIIRARGPEPIFAIFGSHASSEIKRDHSEEVQPPSPYNAEEVLPETDGFPATTASPTTNPRLPLGNSRIFNYFHTPRILYSIITPKRGGTFKKLNLARINAADAGTMRAVTPGGWVVF